MSAKQTQKIRDRIQRKAGLTDAGMRWIEQVCDPFPDEAKSGFVGFPDENQAKSVIMEIKQALQLTCPASLAGQKWSALIFTSGDLRRTDYSFGVPRYGQPMEARTFEDTYGRIGTGIYPIQPLTVYCAPDGEHLFVDNDALPWNQATTDRWQGLNFEDFVKDRCRLLGGAIEIHDTSPELYKSGSLTVVDVSSTFVATNVITNNYTFDQQRVLMNAIHFNAPPATLDEATLLPGSRTWEAKDGVYATLKQSKMENPYEPTQFASPVWATSYPALANGDASGSIAGVGVPPSVDIAVTTVTAGTVTSWVPYGTPVLPVPFDLKCIILSGLDPNASYRINFNAIIEAIPDLDDQQLLVLAKPGPPLDTAAIELYSEIMGELPSGVPVRENLSGEWLQKVLGAMEKYAAPIGDTLGMLGVPGASMVGNSVSKLAGLGKNSLEKKAGSTASKKATDKVVSKRK